MIRSLRNKHRHVWLTMSVLLPAGIILAWLAIPNPIPAKKAEAQNPALLPVISASKDTVQYCIRIRSDKNKINWQLQWINKLELAVPSAVIYEAENKKVNIANARLIGRIEATGEYIFPLNIETPGKKELYLVLYDFIHEKLIDSVNLKML